MTIVVPSADPIWTRNVNYTQFGGHIEKTNRLGVSSFNPKTDISAQQFSAMVDYVARMSWVAPFCAIKFKYLSTDVTYYKYFGQNGIGITYAPTATVSGSLEVTLVFDTTYVDSYDVEGGIDLTTPLLTPQAEVSVIPWVEVVNSYTIKISNLEEDVKYSLVIW